MDCATLISLEADLKLLLVKYGDQLPTEDFDHASHFLNHGELEMATESLALSLVAKGIRPASRDCDSLLQLIHSLGLLTETVFDGNFGAKACDYFISGQSLRFGSPDEHILIQDLAWSFDDMLSAMISIRTKHLSGCVKCEAGFQTAWLGFVDQLDHLLRFRQGAARLQLVDTSHIAVVTNWQGHFSFEGRLRAWGSGHHIHFGFFVEDPEISYTIRQLQACKCFLKAGPPR